MDASTWDARYSGTELVCTAEPNRWVVQVLQGRPPGSVVDLAAGEGRNAVWLAEQGWHATKVDFSAVALAKAEALARAHEVQVAPTVQPSTSWWSCTAQQIGRDLTSTCSRHRTSTPIPHEGKHP